MQIQEIESIILSSISWGRYPL